jgi:hypothetical protein
MIENAGGNAGLLDLAVAKQQRADPAQVEIERADRAATDDQRRIRGIVGNRVHHLARRLGLGVDAVHPGLQNFERRRDVVGSVEHVEQRALGAFQRRLQHEGQFDLDTGRVETVERDRRCIG